MDSNNKEEKIEHSDILVAEVSQKIVWMRKSVKSFFI